ncbi:MAG: hypothetical protein ACYTEQ_03525 [Planctomycetota bacterium]|jgi:hypothetical protein
MTLADIVKERLTVTSAEVEGAFLVRLTKTKTDAIEEYRNPRISASGKYCDAGNRAFAPGWMGGWIPCEEVEIVEELT